ncbi:unnamed protein product [Linum trigynum]|uniref:Uncharacterized protein n=1 Tax=Linum trigynum TaxID=586398 RepID=A0AAV2E0W3_9ROSI
MPSPSSSLLLHHNYHQHAAAAIITHPWKNYLFLPICSFQFGLFRGQIAPSDAVPPSSSTSLVHWRICRSRIEERVG